MFHHYHFQCSVAEEVDVQQVRARYESRELAVAFNCARGMQCGEQLEWGVLGEPVHHRGALSFARSDPVAVVPQFDLVDAGRVSNLSDIIRIV